MSKLLIEAMERRILPDGVIRFGIRKLCKERLKDAAQYSAENYANALRRSPVAIHTDDANKQHYELPPEFFNLVLGKNRKYSSAFWPENCKDLGVAEDLALATTIERAEIVDGMDILELGCGWGSLTMKMAKEFPKSKIIAVSNSAPQRLFIENELKKLNIKNVTILTRNVANLEEIYGMTFHRVVSVEMFEHLRNYQEMFKRISGWLKPDGKLFIHIFTHQKMSYFFETEGEDNWMGKYFFTGGQMPSHTLFSEFQDDLKLTRSWSWDGTHYGKTSEAWLENMDKNSTEIMKIMEDTYGFINAKRWFQRWRVFFMSCAELFNYDNGKEWGVSHYLFSKK